MQRKYLILFTCFTWLFFTMIACKDGTIAISNGESNTAELDSVITNIDIQDYKGLEDVILNNVVIQSESLPIMLIFGNNNCSYCEKLKNDIHENRDLRDFIKKNFQTYYINTSYSKNHEVAYLGKTVNTDFLAKYYNLSSTPLVLWLEPNGNEILKLVGYNADYFQAMLYFVHNKEYGDEKDSTKRMQMFVEKYAQAKLTQ